MPILRRLSIAVLLVLAAALPAAAQRRAEEPRRPALPASADPNDARAYYELGLQLIGRRPAEASAAFWWASALNPAWADPVYGRHSAMLLADPRLLLRYYSGDRGTLRSAQAQRLDSLYLQALTLDPFLVPRFERELMHRFVMTWATGGQSVDPTVDMNELRHLVDTYLQDNSAPPSLRARMLTGDGRHMDALRAYEEALRRPMRGDSRAGLRQERARLFTVVGNQAQALEELRLAVGEHRASDERDLVRMYQSKAVLEHSAGTLHERTGDAAAAQEAYGRAIAEDMAYHPAHLRLGGLALAAGDTATALSELALAVQVRGDHAPGRVVYGALLARLQKLDEAAEQFTAAAGLAPHYAEPHFYLGMVRDWQGRTADAVAAYRAFLERATRADPRREQVQAMVEALAAAVPTP
ncbi:MAG TPA: tetratricopeptide repeat protein [Longimicrobium sp.]|nr:tetratricopeptide repeat protein [Longimicrobium sp.]